MSGRGPSSHGHSSSLPDPADKPMVMAPPLPAKNRPFSTGPDKQGVTPMTRVGALRGCPSSSSLFTQPLNQELLTATCGEDAGSGLRAALAGLGTG